MSFGCYPVAFTYVCNETPDLDYVTSEFMSHGERRLAAPSRPVVPLVDVNVGAAYSGAPNANENFVFADLRTRNITQFESRTRRNFYECFQSFFLRECGRLAIAFT
jgi:hypothetical protein